MADVEKEFFNTSTISADFFDLIVGEKLGSGVARTVYRHRIDPSLVIKFETPGKSFQNVMEWEVWRKVERVKGIASWFAPCVEISASGAVLIQKFASDIDRDDLPDRVPTFFTDLQVVNWGRYRGKPVCRDYGVNLAISNSITTKTKKADWYEDDYEYLRSTS